MQHAHQVARGILIGTGGGIGIDDSIIPEHFACPSIDLIGVHTYDGVGSWQGRLGGIVSTARASGKRVIFEEFGADGKQASKSQKLGEQLAAVQRAGLPWAVWQVMKPNQWREFETFVEDGAAWAVLSDYARQAWAGGGAFSWPEMPR